MLTVFLGLLSFVFPASASEKVRIPNFWDSRKKLDKPDFSSIRQIRFLTEDDYPPFHFKGPDGQMTGFEVELAKALCDEMKVACTIQPIRWDGLAAALTGGQGDAIIAAMRISPESRQRFAFTSAYFRSPARFVVMKSTEAIDVSAGALQGKKVAVVAGSAHEAYLKAYFRSVDLLRMPHATASLEAVRSKEAAAAFVDGVTAAFWLNGEAAAECCMFAGGPYTEQAFFGEGAGIALRPDQPSLRLALDWALQRVASEGKYASLYLKYFPVSPY